MIKKLLNSCAVFICAGIFALTFGCGATKKSGTVKKDYLSDKPEYYPTYGNKNLAVEDLVYIFSYLIPASYYKPVSNMKDCVAKTLKSGFAACLDKYSRYIPQELASEEESSREVREYVGIGIALHLKDGRVKIYKIFEDGPAYKYGMAVDDVILAVSDGSGQMQTVDGKDVAAVVKMIRGAAGTQLAIDILRGDEKKTIKLTRSAINSGVVRVRQINSNIADIKIIDFDDETLALKLQQIFERARGNIILDLRDNPGGYLEKVTVNFLTFFDDNPSELLVTERKYNDIGYEDILVYTIGSVIAQNPGFKKTLGKYKDRKIVVLVNGNSASAAEIVAGFLQEHGAIVIGTQTNGKGTVQTTIEGLPSGAKVYLTIAEYFIGNKMKKVEGLGITPNIVVKNPDGWVPRDTENDLQLQKAIEVLS